MRPARRGTLIPGAAGLRLYHRFLCGAAARAGGAPAEREGIMMRLHDTPQSGNGYKVRLLLTQLDIPFERIELRHRQGRDADAGFLAQEPERPRSRCSSSRTARSSPNRTRSSGTSPKGRRSSPATAGARRGAAVDVLRAVQPRAQHRDVALLDHATGRLTPPRERAARAGERGYAALGVMERHLARQTASSASATRSPTSRSTPTPMSPTRAASTSRAFPAVRAWLARIAAEPRHVPIE